MKIRDPKKQFPHIENPPEVIKKPDDQITEIRKYRLITPLFGGGVKAGEADPVTVIRGASVRGQLRFWWRATRGGQFDTIEKLREAENAIWGSAAKKGDENTGPSKVVLEVKTTNQGRLFSAVDSKGKSVANIGNQISIYSYVSFPLRDTKDAKVLDGVEFQMTIRYPAKRKDDVQAALWAWETFGGIGARTRRGFGALQLTHLNQKPVTLLASTQIQHYIEHGLQAHAIFSQLCRDVPFLSRNCVMVIQKSKFDDAAKTWRFLFDKLKKFRQARHNNKAGFPFGLSKWPEADAVRRSTSDSSPGHEPKHPVENKFPRAQFGLPIILKFKDEDERAGDPASHTLKPKDSERWASPLILRPIACADGFIGLAVRLSSLLNELDGGVVLEDNQKQTHLVEWSVNQNDARNIEPLQGKTDVIAAFLDYLTK